MHTLMEIIMMIHMNNGLHCISGHVHVRKLRVYIITGTGDEYPVSPVNIQMAKGHSIKTANNKLEPIANKRDKATRSAFCKEKISNDVWNLDIISWGSRS